MIFGFLIVKGTILNDFPFETFLSSEITLPNEETIYNPSYPITSFQISPSKEMLLINSSFVIAN